MPRYLIDEDLPISTPAELEEYDYPVESVRSLDLRGATDREVMARADDHGKIVVTRDKDFGDVLRYPKGDDPGAVIVRLPHTYAGRENQRTA